MSRRAEVVRATTETKIRVVLEIDGSGQCQSRTGVGFLDHMLTALARHGGLDLEVDVEGDLHIDMHHTVEDAGIAIGQAFRQALGKSLGITRFASVYIPMDETLTRCAVDLCNRPFLVWKVCFPTEKIGTFDTQLFQEFHRAFAQNAGACVHLETLYGENSHHIAESGFKALARALRAAAAIDPRAASEAPSTKGVL
jgi:imidazoleglycerol-phosphate dehydratase